MTDPSHLLQAVRAGDRDSWEELLQRYERLIWSVPRRCGLNEDDAADVFQAVCLALLQHLDDVRDGRQLAAWLVTTARRESWRIGRRRHREPNCTTQDGDEVTGMQEVLSEQGLPEDETVRLVEAQLVRDALGEMGERCRRLLEWLYQTEPSLSYQEIAQRLNVSVGAVGPTRMRCLQHLRKLLETRGF